MGLIGLALAAEGEVCTGFGATGDAVEVLGDEEATELQSSGVAASRTEDDLYYTHGDQGDSNQLYLFYGDGTWVGAQSVQNADNTDWEDIASGPCPATVDAEHCLWIADIGDNDDTRDEITVWVVPESTQAFVEAVACNLAYPEGKRHDAEAILVSPDGELRIVTKSNDNTKVYRLSDPACDDGSAQTLTEEAELDLGEQVTGGAMSPDGTAVVLRGLTEAWLWTGCSINWSATPTPVDLGSQPQGEAVTFANDGSLVTTSEGSPLRMWVTPCDATEPLECPDCGCEGDAAAVFVLPMLGWVRRARRRR